MRKKLTIKRCFNLINIFLSFALIAEILLPHKTLALEITANENLSDAVISVGEYEFNGRFLPDDLAVKPEKLEKETELKIVREMIVTTTAYSSTVDQCDGDPFVAASGKRVHDGMVAANFLPFDTKIRIPEIFGDKIFIVEDRMNRRFQNRLDIWMETRGAALRYGVREVKIEIVE